MNYEINFSELESTLISETPENTSPNLNEIIVSPTVLHFLSQIDGFSSIDENTPLEDIQSMLEEFDNRMHKSLKLNENVKQSLNFVDSISSEFFMDTNKNSSFLFNEFPEFFKAPSDQEQCLQIEKVIESNQILTPENWNNCSLTEKVSTLQELENNIAKIEHRPPSTILVEPLSDNIAGYFDPNTKNIYISEAYIKSKDTSMYVEALDTLIHEGRHAYQNYNLTTREVHSNHSAVEEWRRNYNVGYESFEGGPLNFRNTGFKLYTYQPVEYDARVFAGNVIDNLKMHWGVNK